MRDSVSVSRRISASIVGTEVRNVTPKRPIASTYRRASNCGSRTIEPCAANTTLLVPSAFMWKSGAATMKRSRPRSLPASTRDRTAQRWPSWDSGTPLGRPVEPEVYSTIAVSRASGRTAANSPWSRSASKPSAPVESKSTSGMPAGTCARRSPSQNASFTAESRITKSIVSRGNLWFTGTETSPARIVPK